jgi:Zn-dependent M28 family amino/carboxypeptidase
VNAGRGSALAIAGVICMIAASCASDDSGGGSSSTDAPVTTLAGTTLAETTSPVTTLAETTHADTTLADISIPETMPSEAETTIPAEPAPATTPPAGDDVRAMVEVLASDEMNGRDNLTPGSQLARDYIVGQLEHFAVPGHPWHDGSDDYLQPFDLGTNVIAWIPGGDLSEEFVVIGGHYDHVGSSCRDVNPADDICNGATDNASGTAVVIDVARSIAAQGVPRRSVVVALWDAEEDGLLGSSHYLTDPMIPLEQTVAYVNIDIQGSDLLPSVANTTLIIGAETGGASFVDAAVRAAEASTLDTLILSQPLFGQGRSDHAAFVDAGIPSVFLTDATNGCYHTVDDEVGIVDFGKLDQQLVTAKALVRTLVSSDEIPVFDPVPAPTTYDDAVQMLEFISAAEPDFALLRTAGRIAAERYLVNVRAVVDAGPESFDDAANAILLGGSGAFVVGLAQADCISPNE